MALAFNVKVGESVQLDHVDHGPLGTLRVDKMPNGGQYGVRLIFDMPRSVIIRVLNHRVSRTTFGLTGEPRGPIQGHLKSVAV